DRVAGALWDAFYAGTLIALADGAVLGNGDPTGGVLDRLPIRIAGAALDVGDRLAVELEGHAQLDQRLYLALPGDDALRRRRDVAQMAGADGGKGLAARPLQIDHAPPGEIALQRARGLLLDLRPRRAR